MFNCWASLAPVFSCIISVLSPHVAAQLYIMLIFDILKFCLDFCLFFEKL